MEEAGLYHDEAPLTFLQDVMLEYEKYTVKENENVVPSVVVKEEVKEEEKRRVVRSNSTCSKL